MATSHEFESCPYVDCAVCGSLKEEISQRQSQKIYSGEGRRTTEKSEEQDESY
jgi:hypothetical protein